jgi:hypothetical protein
MKKMLLVLAFVGLATAQLVGQDCGNAGSGFAGPITAQCGPYPSHLASAALAHRDQFHPEARYAYSRAGVDATRMNAWNQQKAAEYPWHGNYSYWRFGVPTALVVPPTAVFQSEYNWGVAQTKSLPIYHQFGRTYSESGTGGSYPPHPYWPSSTNQFGIYPVRAPH